MKTKLLNISLVIILLVAIPGTLMLASDISGALYKMSITVSNNGTLANYVSTNGVISTPNLIAGGFLNSSANNCAVLDAADNDVPFMPGYSTNPWAFWVETIGADAYINYDLYTADTTGGSIAYFPAATGMIVSDNSTLEMGSAFEIELDGWINTTLSANESLVYKQDAYRTAISSAGSITSGIYIYGSIYPTVETTNGGGDAGAVVNHPVDMPAGVVSGDLLVVFTSALAGGGDLSFPGGWIQLYAVLQVNVRGQAFYKVSDGTEGASIIATSGGASLISYTSYRISGFSSYDVPEATTAQGNNANPNPPALAPTWGEQTTLWLASCQYQDETTVINAYPALYTDGRNDLSGAGGTGTGSARRENTTANEDPGAFTLSAGEHWVASTVGIAPAFSPDVSVTATPVTSDEYTVTTYGVQDEPVWATGDVLHFDGTATSNINAGVIHNASAKLWVSVWFKLDSAFSDADVVNRYTWGKRIGANDRIYSFLNEASGALKFKMVTGGVTSFDIDSTETSWAADTWYHVLYSISDVAGVRLVVNGGVAVTDADNTAAPNGGDLVLGSQFDGGTGGLVGVIANVAVGTGDLSVPEEAALYAGIIPTGANAPTNYWYIDEGTGLTTYDYGSGGNDGTIDNAPTWETSTFTTGSTGRWCDFYIEVDDGVADPDRWGRNLKGASVPDNGNDWEIGLDYSMPYIISADMSGQAPHFTGVATSLIDCGILYNDATKFWVSAWFKLDSDFTVGSPIQYIWNKYDAGANRTQLYLTGGDGKLHFYHRTLNVLRFDISTVATNWERNVWYHVIGSISDTVGARLIVNNGVAVTNADTNPLAAVGSIRIGSRHAGAVDGFIGVIANVVEGTDDLTADEETGLYNGVIPTDANNIWYADEGVGVNIIDYGTDGNDGTADAAITWVGSGDMGNNNALARGAWTWEYDSVFYDRNTGAGNDATPSFRTASSDADVVATAVSFQPIEEAKAPAWTLLTDTATWYTAANITGNFTTTPAPTFPGAGVIEDISTATGTPAQLPFTILYGFIILAVSLSLSSVLRHYGSRSLLVKTLVIGGMLGIGEALGVIDFWMLLFFLIMALTFMAASKPGEVV